jgi:hypothetical protein
MAYDPSTATGRVRLLINDTSNNPVFADGDIEGFLALEGQSVKLAAAQALDVIADDEALTSKVVSVGGASANGPAVADSLSKRAASLREQAVTDTGLTDDDVVFEIIPIIPESDVAWWAT